MDNILDKIKNTRLLAGIGIALMILGTIFSYVSYSFFGYDVKISLWDYWEGKIIIIIAIANLLLIFKDIVEKYVPSLGGAGFFKKIKEIQNPKASLVPTFLGAAFALYLTIKLDVNFANYSLGFYFMWIGVISLVVYAMMNKHKESV